MARPFAAPPSAKAFAGMSSVVTKLVAMRKMLMMTAAVARSQRVLRIRSSRSFPLMSGITATPVSKPESPRASFGKRMRQTPSIPKTLGCCAKRALFHCEITSGRWMIASIATPVTTAFRTR